MTQYTMEKTRAQVGEHYVAQFLDTSRILGLCKKPDLLNSIETNIREIKGKYLPLLVLSLGERVARLELGVRTLKRARGGRGGMASPNNPHPSDPHHYPPPPHDAHPSVPSPPTLN